MVNNVIRAVNYVIAARPSLLNFMIADRFITATVFSSAVPSRMPLRRLQAMQSACRLSIVVGRRPTTG
jgi:hypothetical protein